MAQGSYTPLQVNTAAGLLDNQGLLPLPPALTNSLAAFNATTVIANWNAAVNLYVLQSYANADTLEKLLTIGSSVCPALGNSIPKPPLGDFPNLSYVVQTPDGSTLMPYGFSGYIQQLGNAYLGDGDAGRFCQGFLAVANYIRSTNALINSTVNSNTYLGPTFDSVSALSTNNLSQINPDNLSGWARDLANLGNLFDLQDLENYGTPAGVLRQVSVAANLGTATLPPVQRALLDAGLTNQNIADVVSNNIADLFNASGITVNELDRLQRLIYQAMKNVTGAALSEVLQILDVTTPNIMTMADLLDPKKIYPNSFDTLQTPTPSGWQPIFDNAGDAKLDLQEIVGIYLPQPSGCDQLAKIIPPDQAVANKAIQNSLAQISNIEESSVPILAQVLQGYTREPWRSDRDYTANSLVALAESVNGIAVIDSNTEFYRAQQDVPAGTNISDPAYWVATDLGGINTMQGLPLIEDLPQPVAASNESWINNNIATGSGPGGTLTFCDVLGLAINHADFNQYLDQATAAINTMQTAGVLNTLNATYTNMLAAANDAAWLTLIATANGNISALSANPNVTILNTAFVNMATVLNQELAYQNAAGVDYFVLTAGEQISIFSFVQNLNEFGQDTTGCGANEFLQSVADSATLAGQSLIASMRDAQNQARLAAGRLSNPGVEYPSSDPAVTPTPAVLPVN